MDLYSEATAHGVRGHQMSEGPRTCRTISQNSSEKKACTLYSNCSTQLMYLEGCPNPPKTRKQPREAEFEQATEYRRTKRSRKLVQQLSPVQQPKDRKRRRETLDPVFRNSAEAPRKRARRSLRNAVVQALVDKEEAAIQVGEEEIDPIRFWTKTHNWPEKYATQSDINMSHLLARQKSLNSLRRKRSEPSSAAVPSERCLATRSRGKSKVPLTRIRGMKLYLQRKVASWKNPTLVFKIQVRRFATHSSIRSRRFPEIPCFEMTFSNKAVRGFGIGMRPELFKILLD